MSEYWKSTPKYWCKHCKTYVRDTKLEKANHEATPKHQGNLKRFVRDLHRNHEKDEKDKERSKHEVERLKGLVSGGGSSAASGSGSSSSAFGRGPTPSAPKQQATEAQRKKQLAQLAEMGVEIPIEFRPEMAMPGEWQVTSERLIDPEVAEKKPEALALGVRKREVNEEEAELNEAKKRRWGQSHRTYPTEEEDDGLDALLNNATYTKVEAKDEVKIQGKDEVKDEVKQESDEPKREEPAIGLTEGANADGTQPVGIKRELSDAEDKVIESLPPIEGVKQEAEETVPGVVFKKRKAKNIRQK
ncbi:hypothetical protein VTL71DRAFT_5898 [Oculimacula yallundae]|uniref:U1-type domain-containing protein n=1 Tax=Oculimacula yallundae TaxID=86028 RepID=A0ABR4BZZ1_9HELO